MPTLTPTSYGFRVTHTSHEDTQHQPITIVSRRTEEECETNRQYTAKRRTIERHQQRYLKQHTSA